MEVLMLSPESPYPLNGGGAFRTASLLHYFAQFAQVDLILISSDGSEPDLPAGLVRSQQTIVLPRHNREPLARYLRNARRALHGIPPLIDRLAGLSAQIENAIGTRRYDFGVVEHFWCAPYVDQLAARCEKTVLDLHNIESVLHERCSALSNPGLGDSLIRAGHRRFGIASRKLESSLFPRFSTILTTSEDDRRLVRRIAPESNVHVYPNALPWVETPRCPESPRLLFSANFEYHPNIDAVEFLIRDIWPEVRKLHPELRLRLVGRGDSFIRHLLPRVLPGGSAGETGIEVTGPVPDAQAEIGQARLVVAPLRAGSGTRIKILEAWAAARCVVATPLAAEGLHADDGANIALESGAPGFISRIAALLANSTERQRLATAGRQTFERHYSWETAWRNLDLDLQLTCRSGVNGYTGNF